MTKAVKIISALTVLFVFTTSDILIRHPHQFAIFRAIEANNITMARKLINKKPSLINRRYRENGMTPLHRAAERASSIENQRGGGDKCGKNSKKPDISGQIW